MVEQSAHVDLAQHGGARSDEVGHVGRTVRRGTYGQVLHGHSLIVCQVLQFHAEVDMHFSLLGVDNLNVEVLAWIGLIGTYIGRQDRTLRRNVDEHLILRLLSGGGQ